MIILRLIPLSSKKRLVKIIANSIGLPDAKSPYIYNVFTEDVKKSEGKFILVTGAIG